MQVRLAALLRGMDGVLGFIILINKSEGKFTDEDARFLLAFSNEAAVIIENFGDSLFLGGKRRRGQDNRRLAIIGEMSAQIAHEIRNPLQKILTGVEYPEGLLQTWERSRHRCSVQGCFLNQRGYHKDGGVWKNHLIESAGH